jgi:very-short-patch-repair endonuclease
MDELNRLFRRQHSLATYQQAAGIIGQRRVRTLVDAGMLQRYRWGVLALAGVVPTKEQAIMAAVLAAGDGAHASHATALTHWNFPRIEPDEIELVVPVDRRVRLEGVTAHRTRAMFDADLTVRHHIPTVTGERALVDVSGRLRALELGNLVDAGMRRKVVYLDRLRRCVNRLEGGPGRRPSVVHEVLARRLPGYDPGESDLESRALRAIVAAGLPLPRQQYRVRIGRRTYRIDLAYPELRIAIEVDSWEYHAQRSAFDDDRVRGNLIVLEGWVLLRYTSSMSDDEIVAITAAALAMCGQKVS